VKEIIAPSLRLHGFRERATQQRKLALSAIQSIVFFLAGKRPMPYSRGGADMR
jgi:hypothetical protein